MGHYKRRGGVAAQRIEAKRTHCEIGAKGHFCHGKHQHRDAHRGDWIASNGVFPPKFVEQRRTLQRCAQFRDILVVKRRGRLGPPKQH